MDQIEDTLLSFLIILFILLPLSIKMIYKGPQGPSNNKKTYILLGILLILFIFFGLELIKFFTKYRSS